ncbi:hypothetical protein E2C01_016698 [Portunus trituberculatus]|uniref:Uncharacterized protein n=1 Tax=Portunus trituberculatus TaxID=210409 RepID=A0A5B7DRW1_PORTR|nr:hypothetical protein [Portunus trituberculatus]
MDNDKGCSSNGGGVGGLGPLSFSLSSLSGSSSPVLDQVSPARTAAELHTNSLNRRKTNSAKTCHGLNIYINCLVLHKVNPSYPQNSKPYVVSALRDRRHVHMSNDGVCVLVEERMLPILHVRVLKGEGVTRTRGRETVNSKAAGGARSDCVAPDEWMDCKT